MLHDSRLRVLSLCLATACVSPLVTPLVAQARRRPTAPAVPTRAHAVTRPVPSTMHLTPQGALVQDDLGAPSLDPTPHPFAHVTVVPPAGTRPAVATLLATTARDYRAWGAVDDVARWAPALCLMPPAPALRSSRAPSSTPHGSKVYKLYASASDAYGASTRADRPTPPPTGLVVIKESFAAQPTTQPTSMINEHSRRQYVQHDAHVFERGEFKGLYVMMKMADNTPNTDNGWVYGTIQPNGVVTSLGRVESCMGCHTQAPHGRLFGLQPLEGATR